MSIWSSINLQRSVLGWRVDHVKPSEAPTITVDVAYTYPDFHDCIRLSISAPYPEQPDAEVMLDPSNIEHLISDLQAALDCNRRLDAADRERFPELRSHA